MMTAESVPASQTDTRGTHAPFPLEAVQQGARILVVDDENGPRQALRMLLKEEHDVQMASSVDEAMGVLARALIDIIITDIRMPNETGLDLLRKVRQHYPEVEVLILTGYGELDTALEAIEYGAFAYLEKPFDKDLMLQKVRACTEKHRQEQNRRALEYLALEANRFETLGRLVTGTLHDLGTPLSVIGAHLDLIAENPDRSDIEKRFATMRSQVGHCNDLVRTTMNFLRKSPQGRCDIDLNSVVSLCMDVAQPQLVSKRIEVNSVVAPGIVPFEGELVLVRQAVLNLIYNACQAMEAQVEPRILRLRTYQENGHVCLAIQDNGPGVPKQDRERIFNTLYTTKGKDGTGLGLAVVKNVMHRHNGTVSIEDYEGGGACFVLKFPIS